jgi:hypothetical protein
MLNQDLLYLHICTLKKNPGEIFLFNLD